MLSVCLTTRNRTSIYHNNKEHPLLPRCIDCLDYAAQKLAVPVELIISDWGSTDRPINWVIKRLAPTSIDLTIVHMPADAVFSRGEGLNVAAHWARYPVLFFLDTDMLFTASILEHAISAVKANKAYFPICWTFDMPSHAKGHWRINGHGITAVSRTMYLAANKWDEYKQWGGEDLHFFNRIGKLAPIDRNKEVELRHQWHPQLNTTKGAI